MGVGANEYSHVLSTSSFENIEAQFGTGNATSVIAGRVVLRARTGRPGGSRGYRVQLVAGRHPSGVSGLALRGLRFGPGRWGERLC